MQFVVEIVLFILFLTEHEINLPKKTSFIVTGYDFRLVKGDFLLSAHLKLCQILALSNVGTL